jgi:ABC-type transport system involved in multi-copper enzyme maturation permease subunit
MRTLHTLYHLTRADFYERIRRPSFLLILATAVLAGYLFVPPAVDAGYRVLQVGVQRGIYNSQWIGLMFGLIAAMHLPLVGFYLVKNTVERDRKTGVGQIIATTPISKVAYVVGKWLSNLAVLVAILMVMTVMAAIMQLVRGEDAAVDVWALLTWIWLMGLPVLALAAAMAVLFECVSFLQGGLGNVIYFATWLGALIFVLSGSIDEATGLVQPSSDLYGFTRHMADIQGQVLAADPDVEIGSSLVNTSGNFEGTFVWEGSGWKPGMILERMIWLGIASAIALIAAIPFDRFDPTHRLGRIPVRGGLVILALLCALPLLARGVPLQERLIWLGLGIFLALVALLPLKRLLPAHSRASSAAAQVSQSRRHGPANPHSAGMADRVARLIPPVDRAGTQQDRLAETSKLPVNADAVSRAKARTHLTPLAAPARRWRFFGVFAAELKLMLRGQSLLWYAGALALNLACLLNPSEAVQRYLLLMVWVWPVLVWSQMGVRERRYGTEQILFSMPRPALRQLPALWLAGVIVAVVAGSGAWLYLALRGEMVSVLAWFVGALFVPALALALGVWVGNSRAFEAVYLLLWYVGPVEQVPALDYAGATTGGLEMGMPLVYLGISAGLVALALIGRRQQIQA